MARPFSLRGPEPLIESANLIEGSIWDFGLSMRFELLIESVNLTRGPVCSLVMQQPSKNG